MQNAVSAAPVLQKQIKTVGILGSTGSIGKNTVDLIKGHREKYRVQVLTANKNVALLAEQAKELNPAYVVIGDKGLYKDLKQALSGSNIEIAAGEDAVCDAAGIDTDWTMAAIVGAAGIKSTLRAIQRGKTVALANKESLVSAGPFMMEAVQKAGTQLLPVDSEHNAVFQVFDQKQREGIQRIILTASGGSFLRKTREELDDITPEQAMRHPNWVMGAKISVDSSTMMNKSLEIIEAAYLFNLKDEKIDVVIHPQSIVHSMVEYIDGSILAQMGAPDMRTPIAHTLAWPDRVGTTGDVLNLRNSINLSFEPIDINRFKSIKIARDALRSGMGYPTTLNAANEIAVEAFLNRKLKFSAIESVVEKTLQRIKIKPISDISDVLALDLEARAIASEIVRG